MKHLPFGAALTALTLSLLSVPVKADDGLHQTIDFEAAEIDPALVLGGDAQWQLANTWQGTAEQKSLQSGKINHNGESVVSVTTHTREGELSFRLAVSSEEDGDTLSFYLDGELQQSWSGEQGWQDYKIAIDRGEHTFKWVYHKNGLLFEGLDAAQIDDIRWPSFGEGADEDGDGLLDYQDNCPQVANPDQLNSDGADDGGDACDADDDNDGISDSWEMEYGMKLRIPYDAMVDSDGDGFSNFREYWHKSIPTDGASKPDRTPGKRLWHHDLARTHHTAPAIGPDGTLYLGTFDKKLLALYPDGSPKWSHTFDQAILSSPTVTSDGYVNVTTTTGDRYQVDYTGKTVNKVADGNEGSAGVSEGLDGTTYQIVSYFEHSELSATDKQGELLWTYRFDDYSQTRPVVAADGTIYFGANDGRLYAINPDGSEKWQQSGAGTVADGLAIGTRGHIYMVSIQGVLSIATSQGNILSAMKAFNIRTSEPVLDSLGNVYVVTMDDRLVVVQPDGSEKWSVQLKGEPLQLAKQASPVIGRNGTIYVGSERGGVYAFSPEGELYWQYGDGLNISSSPVLSDDGILYFTAWGDGLHAVDTVSGGPATRIWSMSQGNRWRTGFIGQKPDDRDSDGDILVDPFDSCPNLYHPDPLDSNNSCVDQDGDKIPDNWETQHGLKPDNAIDGQLDSDGDGLSNYREYRAGTNPNSAEDKPQRIAGQKLWSQALGSNHESRYTSPTIGPDGSIYLATHPTPPQFGGGGIDLDNGFDDRRILALYPDGQPKWSQSVDVWINNALSVSPEGWIYGLDAIGGLYRLSQDGTVDYQKTYPSELTTSTHGVTLGSQGQVYFNSSGWESGANLWSLDSAGSLMWQNGSTRYNSTRPVIGADGTIYSADSWGGALNAFNPDGSIKWSKRGFSWISDNLTLGENDVIYFYESTFDAGECMCHLTAVSRDGELLWRIFVGDTYGGSVLDANGNLYVVVGNTQLHAYSDDGQLLWKNTFSDAYEYFYNRENRPVVGKNGNIYIGTNNQGILAFAPDGTRLWQYGDGMSIVGSPILTNDGTLLFNVYGDGLHAIDTLSGGPAQSPWPMMGGNQWRTGNVSHRDANRDSDADLLLDIVDNCPSVANPNQTDTDGDKQGDACDSDDDNDGVPDVDDAFPLDPGKSADTDGDGIDNIIDTDDDGDGVLDVNDAFPLDATESVDTDGDGIGNNADTDDDGDGVADGKDAFPLDASESLDTDGDGIGNNADTDDDGDGVADSKDAFPLDATETVDTDNDGIGNNTDTDDDGDGIPDRFDGFPLNPVHPSAVMGWVPLIIE